jgi:IclR family transcriptional regulator, pca regulon regulatory protein
MSRDDPDFIDSVEKALRLLLAFSADEPFLRVSRAAEVTGLSRATARRLFLTFERLGLVEQSDGAYRLTPRVLRIGYSYLSSLPIWEHAQDRLRTLADALNESCSAATLDGNDIVYVVRIPAKRSMSLTLSVGSRLPAYPTSMGRVLLAALPADALERYLEETVLEPLTSNTVTDVDQFRSILEAVRAHGYAVLDGEREVGVRSAAAPVHDHGGRVIAAINVSVNAARVSMQTLTEEMVPKLRDAADDLSARIGVLATAGP